MGFRPGLPMSLFVAFFLPVTVSLGIWQLNRAEQKIQVSDRMAEYDNSVVPFTDLDSGRIGEQRYGQRTELCAIFRGDAWLLDNRTYDGAAGYDVYWPGAECESGDRVLVRLGWVSSGPTRSDLPALPSIPDGPLNMVVEIRPYPSDPFLTGPPEQMSERVWRFQSLGDMPDSGYGESNAILVQVVEPEELALPDNWDPVSVPPGRHIAYAVQWFGLAAVLVLGYLIWGRHRFNIMHRSE